MTSAVCLTAGQLQVPEEGDILGIASTNQLDQIIKRLKRGGGDSQPDRCKRTKEEVEREEVVGLHFSILKEDIFIKKTPELLDAKYNAFAMLPACCWE